MGEQPHHPGFEQDLSPPPASAEQAGVAITPAAAQLGQLALESGEDMTTPLRDRTVGERVDENEPYAPIPDGESPEKRAQYYANFKRAVLEKKDRHKSADAEEELARSMMSNYLWSHYDPRPYEDIASDFRYIAEHLLSSTSPSV